MRACRYLSVSLVTALSLPLSVEGREHTLQLEEVVVSARKRAESLQEVPISVFAISADSIAQKQIRNLEDLALYTPNLHIGQAGIADQLFIRGVGSGVNRGFEQSVGTFIDGVYYGRGRSSRNPLFDVEQVEILKGPQSLLLGKNTVAGAINIRTARPTSEWQHTIEATYESGVDTQEAQWISSGPLSNQLNMRLAGKVSQQQGWLYNSAKQQHEPDSEQSVLRLSLNGQFTEQLQFFSKLETSSVDVDGRSNQLLSCSESLQGLLQSHQFFDDCSDDEHKSSSGSIQQSMDGLAQYDFSQDKASTDANHALFSLTLDREVYQLSSNTAYVSYQHHEISDGDFTQLSALSAVLDEDFQQLSQELRWTTTGNQRWRHIGGVYLQRNDYDFLGNVHLALLEVPPGNFAGTRLNQFEQTEKSYAAFYQLQWQPNQEWELSGGFRYTRESKQAHKKQILAELNHTEASDSAFINGLFAALSSVAHDLHDQRRDQHISPSLSASWFYHPDHMLYTSISHGFKGGGYDAVLGNGDPARFEYQKETVLAYELGHKTQLGQATINSALFYSEFNDVQVSTFDGGLGFLVSNAGKTRSYGVEMDSQWQPTASVQILTAVAYLQAQYLEFPDAQCYHGQTVETGCVAGFQDLSGRDTQFSPQWQTTLSLIHQLNIGQYHYLKSIIDWRYIDDYFIANDLDPALAQAAYSKFNLALSLAPHHQQWQLQLLVKNLTDQQTSNWGNDVPLFGGSYFIHSEPPRTVSLNGRWHW